MKFIFLFLLLFFSGNSFGLVNGVSIEDEFPVIQIVFKNNSHACSGIFPDSYSILTAAHCISDQKTWEGFSLKIGSIFDSKGNLVNVRQVKNIPHPQFESRWYGNSHDVGIIKSTKLNFEGVFPKIVQPDHKPSYSGFLYGCRKVNFESKIRKCLKGKNSYSSFF